MHGVFCHFLSLSSYWKLKKLNKFYVDHDCFVWSVLTLSGNLMLSKGLQRVTDLSPEQQNSLVRQLRTTIMAQTEVLRFSEREHIAMLLVNQYPFLKGSFGAGHVSIFIKNYWSFYWQE